MPIDERMVDYGYGTIIPNYSITDEPTLISHMGEALVEFYESSGIRKTFVCDQPTQNFGWIIDEKGVRIGDCGCYVDAVWPMILSLGAGPILANVAKEAGELVASKIIKSILIKRLSKFREITALALTRIRALALYTGKDYLYDSLKKTMTRLGFAPNAGNGSKLFKIYHRAWEKMMKFANDMDTGTELGIISFLDSSDKAAISFLQNAVDRENALNKLKNGISKMRQKLDELLAEARSEASSLTDKSNIDALEGLLRDGDQVTHGFNRLIDEYEAVIDKEFGSTIPNAKTIGSFSAGIAGLLAFIFGVLSYLNIVVPKECGQFILDDNIRSRTKGPWDPSMSPSARDAVFRVLNNIYFQGNLKGYNPCANYINNELCKQHIGIGHNAEQCQPSWFQVKECLIKFGFPVWPDLDTDCKCSSCPKGYELCSYASIINGWSDTYNICLPVCGGQKLKPISLPGLITRANCSPTCPDGYEWVNCNNSDCPSTTPCIPSSDSKGFCVKTPEIFKKLRNNGISSKYASILWDSQFCRWICRNGNIVMDWKKADNKGNDNYPEGPVNADDPRFDQKIFIPPTGPASMGVWVPKYQFRYDRYDWYTPCTGNQRRIPENDCKCSGSYSNSGIPEVPEGWIYYDKNLIPLSDFDPNAPTPIDDSFEVPDDSPSETPPPPPPPPASPIPKENCDGMSPKAIYTIISANNYNGENILEYWKCLQRWMPQYFAEDSVYYYTDGAIVSIFNGPHGATREVVLDQIKNAIKEYYNIYKHIPNIRTHHNIKDIDINEKIALGMEKVWPSITPKVAKDETAEFLRFQHSEVSGKDAQGVFISWNNMTINNLDGILWIGKYTNDRKLKSIIKINYNDLTKLEKLRILHILWSGECKDIISNKWENFPSNPMIFIR